MKRAFWFLAIGSVLLCAGGRVTAQSGAKNGEWRTYGGDLGNTHYSPLDQVNAGNFNKLEIAWRFKTDNLGPQPEYNLESTPLMANGVIYSTAGTRRAVVALDATTGELIWTHGEREGTRGTNAPRQLSGPRGCIHDVHEDGYTVEASASDHEKQSDIRGNAGGRRRVRGADGRRHHESRSEFHRSPAHRSRGLH